MAWEGGEGRTDCSITRFVPKMMTVDKKSIALSTVEAMRDIEFERRTTAIFPPSRRKFCSRTTMFESVSIDSTSYRKADREWRRRGRTNDDEIDVDGDLDFLIEFRFLAG